MRGNKGITLVEVLMSIVIFSVLVVSVLSMVIVISGVSKRADYEYTATTIARSRIERLNQMDFALLASANETDTRVNAQGVSDPNGLYLRTTTVGTNYLGDSHLTSVIVDVSYELNGKLNNDPIEMATVLTEIIG